MDNLPGRTRFPREQGRGTCPGLGQGSLSRSAPKNPFSILLRDAAKNVQLETSPPKTQRFGFSPLLKLRKISPKVSHLSQTHPFAVPSQIPFVVLFLPLKLHPGPCRSPCPCQPCKARDDVTGERGAAFQHYISLSGLSNQPPAPQTFHGRNPSPILPPPIRAERRGNKFQTEPGLEE